MEFISQFGSPINALFAFISLTYLIVICLSVDIDKRSYTTQMFLTILNVACVVFAFLTNSMLLFVLWCICLVINGNRLRNKCNRN